MSNNRPTLTHERLAWRNECRQLCEHHNRRWVERCRERGIDPPGGPELFSPRALAWAIWREIHPPGSRVTTSIDLDLASAWRMSRNRIRHAAFEVARREARDRYQLARKLDNTYGTAQPRLWSEDE